LSSRARRDLEELGVECRLGASVTQVTAEGVHVGEERIAARTVFWAAGNTVSPLVASLGAPTDRAGRALVEPDLSVPGSPDVFVIGDAAAVPLHGTPASSSQREASTPYVPGLAAAANQMGEHAARMIQHSIQG